jgi:hypothetical protein
MVGPSRGGRVTAVAGHVDHPGSFYMGATGGGVWKTTDYGISWHNISDGFFSTGSIGAIRVADSDSRIVYVGTGSDGIRSNVITGRGMYKSTDAGATWQFIGLREMGQIGAVLIHPTNPNLVYVAAIGHAFGPSPERGVYRTTDGQLAAVAVRVRLYWRSGPGVRPRRSADDLRVDVAGGAQAMDDHQWCARGRRVQVH